eukprot:gene9265-10229_t
MSLLEAYQQELDSYSGDIRSTLNNMRSLSDVGDFNCAHDHVEDVIGKANEIIKAMELEVRTCGMSERRLWNEKLKSYKDTFAQYKAELTSANFERQKASLVGGKSGDDRRRMLDANERLANQNLVIDAAIRTVAETEEVGNEIIGELKSNREKIESSTQKAQEVGGITDAASRLIKRMTKREWSLGFL